MAELMEVEDFSTTSQAFLNWLHKNGTAISSKIRLADLRQQDAGRGVVANEDIDEDEELFSIPRSSILTTETSVLARDLQAEISDPWLSLIIAMIYEHQRGGESVWKPYFDVLPSSFDTLMFWSQDELKHLEGSAVVNKIGKKSADEAFTAQVIPVVRKYADALNANGTSDDELLSLCHRMGSTIMAYAFDLEKPDNNTSVKTGEDGWEEDEEEMETLPKGMVPLADMLNADANRNNAKLYYEEDKVVMKSIKPIAADEEIFNDYGPLPTADVLRRYGYTTANYAQYDVVEISLDLIKEAAKEHFKLHEKDIHERTAYLDEQGILDDGYDISRASNEDGQFSDELCTLLNTLALSISDFEKLRKKLKLPKPTLSTESQSLLHRLLVARRGVYAPHPVQFYEEALKQREDEKTQSGRRLLMAYQVVKGEKEVLDEAVQALREILQPNAKRKAGPPEGSSVDGNTNAKKMRTG